MEFAVGRSVSEDCYFRLLDDCNLLITKLYGASLCIFSGMRQKLVASCKSAVDAASLAYNIVSRHSRLRCVRTCLGGQRPSAANVAVTLDVCVLVIIIESVSILFDFSMLSPRFDNSLQLWLLELNKGEIYTSCHMEYEKNELFMGSQDALA